tara:strand:- start:15 stop:1931 length:1917 start_codon:yes stop_codon:yes gene_type:complete
MRFSEILVAGAIALAMPAGAAIAQESQTPWADAQACLSDRDVAICWLKVGARGAYAGSLLLDPDLKDSPDILALVGVLPFVARAAPPSDLPAVDVPPELALFSNALDEVHAAIREGVTPEEALTPLHSLPIEGAYAMFNPVQTGLFSFGRLDAYALLASMYTDPGMRTPARDRLVVAILAAWESDLNAVDEGDLLSADAASLAQLLVRRGDRISARRVMNRLSPDNEPALIEGLTALKLFEEAAAVSAAANPARSLERLRRVHTEAERISNLQMREFAAYQQAELDAELAALTAEEQAELDEMLADEIAEYEAQMAANGTVSLDDELTEAAVDELALARDRLISEADRDGKAVLVQTTVRQVVNDAMRNPEMMASGSRLARGLELLVRTSEPSEAIALTEQVEAHARSYRTSSLGQILPAIHAAWLHLDRPDRATAMIEEWRPVAMAPVRVVANDNPDGPVPEDYIRQGAVQGLQAILVSRDDIVGAEALGWLSPDTGLRRDFALGRGISRLDEQLARFGPEEQGNILMTCWRLSLEADDPASAGLCAGKYATLADNDPRRSIAVDGLIQAAAAAAEKDGLETALPLVRRAVEMGAGLEQRASMEIAFSSSLNLQLPHISKAMLRRDGRLAARPSTRP